MHTTRRLLAAATLAGLLLGVSPAPLPSAGGTGAAATGAGASDAPYTALAKAQATRFFQTQAFLDLSNALAEAKRGTQDATYGYYTLGKLEILKLRADYRKKLGPAFTLARFHHDLLQYGDPAILLLRPLLLGADDDGKILPEK